MPLSAAHIHLARTVAPKYDSKSLIHYLGENDIGDFAQSLKERPLSTPKPVSTTPVMMATAVQAPSPLRFNHTIDGNVSYAASRFPAMQPVAEKSRNAQAVRIMNTEQRLMAAKREFITEAERSLATTDQLMLSPYVDGDSEMDNARYFGSAPSKDDTALDNQTLFSPLFSEELSRLDGAAENLLDASSRNAWRKRDYAHKDFSTIDDVIVRDNYLGYAIEGIEQDAQIKALVNTLPIYKDSDAESEWDMMASTSHNNMEQNTAEQEATLLEMLRLSAASQRETSAAAGQMDWDDASTAVASDSESDSD